MNILYVSCYCDKEHLDSIIDKNNHNYGYAVMKYHSLLTSGLAENGATVNTISALPINRANCGKKVIRSHKVIKDKIKFHHLSSMNFPVIKNLHTLISSFLHVAFMKKTKETYMIADVLNISVTAGALLACKLRKIQTCGIITDLPEHLSTSQKGITVQINNKIMSSFDSYLLLTQAMNDVVNRKNKPHVIVEGQVDSRMTHLDNLLDNKYKNKICIYAGGLEVRYGAKYMIDEFIKANVKDAELHLYGRGGFVKSIEEDYKEFPQIKYLGMRPNEDVVAEEMKASLLINPRPTAEEFTKYSFPSKNMEYMVSGTPILTTKLHGMPKEYYKYVYLLENEATGGLTEQFKILLNKPASELHDFGLAAKEFVLREKNNITQAQKILTLFKENF